MKNIFATSSIKWKHTLAMGLLFAIAYIIVDDNNIVSRGIEDTFYYLAWFSIFITIFLVLKKKMS